jgi:hypothetical protein
MPTIIDSLFVRLGFKTDPKGLEGFAVATGKAKDLMIGFGAAVTGAFYGVERLVQGAAERMGGIQNFAEQMGMSARSVDALGKVAKANDSSLEAMESGLRTLTITAGQAAQGVGRGALLFKKYGLSAKDATKPTEELLGVIADKMQKLPSNAQQKAFGSRLGFDDATIFMLAKGRANLEQLRAEALKGIPFADAQYELADNTDKLFRKAGSAVSQLKDRLAVGLFPTVNRVLQQFIAWVKNEQTVRKLQDAINKVVDALSLVARNLNKIGAVFAVILAYKMGAYFLSLGASLMTAAKGQALLTLGLGAMKTLITGGLLGLIFLMAEDLWTYYRGGKSVTGWMMTQFPYAVDVMIASITALTGAFIALTFSSGPAGLAFIGALIVAATLFHNAWDPLDKWWSGLWDRMFDRVADFYNKLPGFVRGVIALHSGQGFDTSEMQKGVLSKNFNSRKAIEKGTANWGAGKDFLKESDTPSWLNKPFTSGAPGSGGNVTTNDVTLNISGAGDPAAVARETMKLLQQEMEKEGGRARVRGKTRDAQGNVVG